MKKGRLIRYVNRSTLTVHTPEALMFCRSKAQFPGNDKAPWKPNIFYFGNNMNKIWANAKADDPYAEFALIQVEKKLDKTSQRLSLFERLAKRMKSRWQVPAGLDIQSCETIEPLTLAMGGKVFNTPHSKSLIVLIARFDALVGELKSLKQFNIVKNKRFHTIVRKATKSMRAVIQETHGYKATGVTRYDIFNKTKLGAEAIEQLGMIPLAVLNRDEYSVFGPTPIEEKKLNYSTQHL